MVNKRIFISEVDNNDSPCADNRRERNASPSWQPHGKTRFLSEEPSKPTRELKERFVKYEKVISHMTKDYQ